MKMCQEKVWSVYELGLSVHTFHLSEVVKPVTHLTACVFEVYSLKIKKLSGICKIFALKMCYASFTRLDACLI